MHVAIDALLFCRELPDEVVAKFLPARNRVEDLVANIEAVVLRVHRRPLEFAARQKVEHFFGTRLGANIADVVHTHIPLIAIALVGMGVTPCRVVLLEHTYFPSKLAQESRTRQPAHARTNDDSVIFRREAFGPVAITDAERAGFHGWNITDLAFADLRLWRIVSPHATAEKV